MIKLLETYLNRIRFANDCFSAYKSILDALHTSNAVINQSPAFFSICLLSLERTLLLELAKLYKGSGHEQTINKLINIIRANQNLFPKKINCTPVYEDNMNPIIPQSIFTLCLPKEISQFELQIDSLKNIVDKLSVRRDKYLAHNDKEYFANEKDLIDNFPINFENIEQIIKLTGDFCNKMLSYLNGTIIAYQSYNATDLSNLLSKVVLTLDEKIHNDTL